MNIAVSRVLGEKLRYQRGVRRWSQARLAKEAGVSRSTIAAVESGRQGMGLDGLFLVAKAMSVEPALLLPTLAELDHANAAIHLEGDGDWSEDLRRAIARAIKTGGRNK